MPSFTTEIEFEVYCGTCGAGLCQESDTRNSRNRSALQVTVNACPKCMKAKDDEISELNEKVESLGEEVEGLQTELETIKSQDHGS